MQTRNKTCRREPRACEGRGLNEQLPNEKPEEPELTTRYGKLSLSYKVRVLGKFLKMRLDRKRRHCVSNSSLLWNRMGTLEQSEVRCDPKMKQNRM